MKKSTYRRKLRKQKMAGLFLLVAGTIGSVLVSNWFIAMIYFPLAALLITSKEIIWDNI